MLNRTQAPQIHAIGTVDFPQVKKQVLSNGVSLSVLSNHSSELLRVDFIVGAGVWQQQKPLQAFLTNQMLKEGSLRFNAQHIADKLDFFGSSLQLSCSYHHAYITVYSLSKYVEQTLEIVESILKESIFPVSSFEVLLNKRKNRFLLEQEKVESIAAKKFVSCVFGQNHPYGKTADINDFYAISPKDLSSYYSEYYGSNNISIVVSGDVNRVVLNKLEQLFGNESWGKQKVFEVKPVAFDPLEQKKHFMLKTNTIQSAVRLGIPCVDRNHPDYFRLRVLNVVLGGYFGGRLMSSIREEKGYTYGISSSLVAMPYAGYFSIATETATEFVPDLIQEVYKEMDRLCIEPVGQSEMQMVKNFALGEMMRAFDGFFSHADALLFLIANNLDNSYYVKQLESIQNISPQQIQLMAQKYFVKEDFYEIVVGR